MPEILWDSTNYKPIGGNIPSPPRAAGDAELATWCEARESMAAWSLAATSSATGSRPASPVTLTSSREFIASTITVFWSVGSARTTTLRGSSKPICRSR